MQTRNRRQEDFIFTIQGKVTILETKNEELLERLAAITRAKEEVVLAIEDSGPEFRPFGTQTETVKVSQIVKCHEAGSQYESPELEAKT